MGANAAALCVYIDNGGAHLELCNQHQQSTCCIVCQLFTVESLLNMSIPSCPCMCVS